jgi:hypothetical protein
MKTKAKAKPAPKPAVTNPIAAIQTNAVLLRHLVSITQSLLATGDYTDGNGLIRGDDGESTRIGYAAYEIMSELIWDAELLGDDDLLVDGSN